MKLTPPDKSLCAFQMRLFSETTPAQRQTIFSGAPEKFAEAEIVLLRKQRCDAHNPRVLFAKGKFPPAAKRWRESDTGIRYLCVFVVHPQHLVDEKIKAVVSVRKSYSH